MTPIQHGDIDSDLLRLEEQQLRVGGDNGVTNEAVSLLGLASFTFLLF